MERNYYVVSIPNSSEEHFEFLFKNDIVAIGYKEFCFTMYVNMIDKEILYKKINDFYKSKNEKAEKSHIEAELFINIKEGDYIIIPYFDSVCLAIATDNRIYDRDVSEHLGFYNQLEVDYIKANNKLKFVSLNSLSKGLQKRLKEIKSTVCELNDFVEDVECLYGN